MYGLIDRAEVLAAEGVLPLGLSYGATVREAVAADEPIPAGAVEVNEASFVARLRERDDAGRGI